MSYLALKHLHVTCVVLSGLGFCLRGWWMLRESPLRQHRLARILRREARRQGVPDVGGAG